MVNQIFNIIESEEFEGQLESSSGAKMKADQGGQWPYPVKSEDYYTNPILKIGCRAGAPSYQRSFTLRKASGWWHNKMGKYLLLDPTYSKNTCLVLPLSPIAMTKLFIKKGNCVKLIAKPPDLTFGYQRSADYILRVFELLSDKGYQITYLESWEDAKYVSNPVLLTIDKKPYQIIIAKLTMPAPPWHHVKRKSYSFFIVECLNLLQGPHHIAIVHRRNLQPMRISQIQKVIKKAVKNKFLWPRCHYYINSLNLKLEKKSRQYQYLYRDRSAFNVNLYFQKTIKIQQVKERQKFIYKAYPDLFEFDS